MYGPELVGVGDLFELVCEVEGGSEQYLNIFWTEELGSLPNRNAKNWGSTTERVSRLNVNKLNYKRGSRFYCFVGDTRHPSSYVAYSFKDVHQQLECEDRKDLFCRIRSSEDEVFCSIESKNRYCCKSCNSPQVFLPQQISSRKIVNVEIFLP
ncbi:uncharacterized protein LOC111713049 isoform X2 [Eurytemora carolleeae]|uniref:uncharacterized protein LOC111713049 isoform X2 n=1 Tax=Eurytemora carolleeae TaxID=1294199 RepID=UPI000C75D20C|nr:uncharacterized protein LOC111713049 isoform X2 [Eurytemora carolleeae]|eukprot:XP_023343606.1 uncharacterized protein LOC111713049 isoform X2 [Eurytemora affinis]